MTNLTKFLDDNIFEFGEEIAVQNGLYYLESQRTLPSGKVVETIVINGPLISKFRVIDGKKIVRS